ncbi:hypothetical protein GE21DRAFT_1354243 [Neurospora crassa]|nr:hypothetical protein B1D1.20 [imported] - Neurospora crassa [Neurospora crassa]KHE82662.1 hypothetical protein GE21DRAFT_1354243 [Neurospora crassa]
MKDNINPSNMTESITRNFRVSGSQGLRVSGSPLPVSLFFTARSQNQLHLTGLHLSCHVMSCHVMSCKLSYPSYRRANNTDIVPINPPFPHTPFCCYPMQQGSEHS